MRRFRSLRFEAFEERLPLAHIAEPFVTAITHGYQALEGRPQWTRDLGTVIERAFGNSSTSPHDVFDFYWQGSGALIFPGMISRPAGERLGRLVAQSILDLHAETGRLVDVHLIGHSRGSIVVSEAAKYLSQSGAKEFVGYFQMTTLDPHPTHGAYAIGGDPELVKSSIVDFWDNYYQTSDFPSGKAYTDALNIDLTRRLDDWEGRGVAEGRNHAEVHDWYHGHFDPTFLAMEDTQRPDAIETFQRVSDFKAVDPRALTFAEAPSLHLPIAGDKVPQVRNAIQESGNVVIIQDDNPIGVAFARLVTVPASRSITTPGAIEFPGDRDRFSVRAVRDGLLKIEAGTAGSQLDSFVSVYDKDFGFISSDDNSGPGTDAKLCLEVSANQLLVVDVSGAGASTGGYELLTSQPDSCVVDATTHSSPDAPPAQDDYPNTKDEARLVGLDASGNATVGGNIHVASDEDWIRFIARQDGNLVIEIDTPRSSLDTHLRLHNDSVLLTQDQYRIVRPVTMGETFYLNVRPGSENGIDDIAHGEDATGQWTVRISQPDTLPGNSGTDGPPGPLPGWGGVRGVQINLDANGNGATRGSIDDPADVRWFQIDGTHAGFMEVTVSPVNDDLQPFVTVFRADGGGIDTDTGEFDGEARVAFAVAENERIIVAVSSQDGRSTGGFMLNTSQPDNPPDDDVHDFGETSRDLAAEITQEGDGAFAARIESPDDNDWFRLPIRGQGFFTIEVLANNSALIPFMELNRDGTSGGFFETDDGRDGKARVSFLPESGQHELWVKVSSLDGTQGGYQVNVWRSQNPDDDFPDSGGVFLQRRPLAEHGQIFINGTMEHPGDSDNFHIRVDHPGAVAVQFIPLTIGLDPFFSRARQHPDQDERTNTTGGGSAGRAAEFIPDVLGGQDNWLVLDLKAGAKSLVPTGDYVLHVWQPRSVEDRHADTVGIEAWPIWLDGSGNGAFPGPLNPFLDVPALNHADDHDVFQIRAASDRPVTVTVNGLDTFLRVYDASGRAIATDRNSGSNGESQITLEANRSDLFYIEVTAFNGTDTGPFTVSIAQPADDHPDSPIFSTSPQHASDASNITLDDAGFGVATGQIDENLVGDRDIFRFTVAERGQATVNVITTNNRLDTLVRVYDSRGNLVAIDDDGGDGRNSRVTLSTFQDETYFVDVGGYADDSIGAYRVTVQHDPPPGIELLGTYDKLTGFDTSKWSLQYAGGGIANLGIFGGMVRLEADGRGASDDNTMTTLTSRAHVDDQVSFDLSGDFGGSFNYGYAEINDGDGKSICIQLHRYTADGANFVAVSSNGYAELENLAPHDTTDVGFTENTVYTFRIKEEAGEVRVYMNDTVLARFAGSLANRSLLHFRTHAAAGSDRYAHLTPANVQGSFTIADPLLAFVPTHQDALTGPYSNFDGASLDGELWATTSNGTAAATLVDGKLTLLADGPGAASDENVVTVESLGILNGNIEFDLKADVGHDTNSAIAAITNGSERIGLIVTRDESGNSIFTVDSAGYTELENAGPQAFDTSSTYRVVIKQADGTIQVYVNDALLARFAGTLHINSVLQTRAESSKSPNTLVWRLFDGFSDSNFDTSKWRPSLGTGPGSGGNAIREQNGRLEISAGGGLNGVAQVTSTETLFSGVRFDLFALSGGATPENSSDYRVRIESGDVNVTIKQLLVDKTSRIIVNGGLVKTLSGTNHSWEVASVDNNIEIRMDGQLEHTIPGASLEGSNTFSVKCLPPTSETQTIGIDNVEFLQRGPRTADDRFAELILDNVGGDFLITRSPTATPYDRFDDNRPDFEKWHVSGIVEERDGTLVLPLFRGGQPVSGYVSTANKPGGMNLRGVRFGFSRTTEPKNLNSSNDIFTRVELTNGQDWLRIGRLHNTTFRFESGGAYGVQVQDVSVPSGEIPDGPFEIRESNGNIEFLHNGNVKLRIPNQTVRAGTYFTFYTHGNPFGQSTRDEPETFEAFIDNVEFYVDPPSPNTHVAPSLKAASDTGSSSADHVTNRMSLDFEWTKAGPDAQYIWREGELLGDGTINYGPWSEPQAEPTTRVDLPHASVHVISVRPIDAAGFLGTESARGFVVDVDAPTVSGFSPTVVPTAPLESSSVTLLFSEPLDAQSVSLADVVSFTGPGGNDLASHLTGIMVDGTEVTVGFATQTVAGNYQLVVAAGVRDVAGNPLDQDGDGVAGEEIDDRFTATVRINTPPAAVADVKTTDEDVLVVVDVAVNDTDVDGSVMQSSTNITTNPTQGTAAVDATGNIIYTPADNYFGSDTIGYTIHDNDGAVSEEGTVSVTVSSVNDAPTAINLGNVNVSENMAGAVVGNVTVSDVDTNDTHEFVVSHTRFEVVNRQLKLKGGQQLDHEQELTVELDITATDSGTPAKSVITTFTLTVTDVNEAPAAIGLSANTVAENAAGARIGAVTVSDPDPGDAHTLTVSDNRFEVAGGNLKLKVGQSLDFESEKSVMLNLTATDLGGLDRTQSFTVNVTNVNEPPISLTLSANSLAENTDTSSAVTVGTLATVDVDAADSHTYTFVAGDGDSDNSLFQVSGDQLQVKAETVLDHEIKASYAVRLTTTDAGGLAIEQRFTVTVTDVNDPPEVVNPIPDQQAVEDSSFAFLFVADTFVDPDGDSLTYTARVSGDANLPAWLTFTAASRQFSGTPTNDDVGMLTVVVTATDQSAAAVSDEFQIEVRNTNDPPIVATPLQDQTATEDLPFNFVLPTGSFHDVDVGDVLTLGAASADGSSLPAWLSFDVESRRFAGTPANEDVGTFSVKVTATDMAGAAVRDEFEIVVLNVNDAPISVSLDSQAIDENAAGPVGGGVTVSDPDVGDAHTLTVSDNRFEIVGSQLKAKDGVTFDHEATAVVKVEVTATDSGDPPLSRTETVSITVRDVNEPPTDLAASNQLIDENSPVGSLVGVLSASDEDADDSHTFSLIDDAGGRFTIDGNQLLVADGNRLDYESAATHQVSIQVADSGGLILSNSFEVSLNDINEAPTAIILTKAEAKENVPGIVIGQLSVADEDAGDMHTFSSSNEDFEVVDDALRLKTGRSLRYDKSSPVVIVTVTATDSGELSRIESLAVAVLPYLLPWQNDGQPKDANNDGSVAPIDALVIINYLNEHGSQFLAIPPADTIVFFYDVNGDGHVSPIDVLLVINHLNGLSNAEGEGVFWIRSASTGSWYKSSTHAASRDSVVAGLPSDQFRTQQLAMSSRVKSLEGPEDELFAETSDLWTMIEQETLGLRPYG